MQPGRSGLRRLVGDVPRSGDRGDQLSLWASGLERFTAERARHDPARFHDVAYDDFVADPFGTAEAAYGYFGLPLSGAAADAMRALVAGAGPRAGGRGPRTGTPWPISA